MEIKKKDLLENRQQLNEDRTETVLMVLGFIPVIGEIADVLLIMKYLREGKNLYAALMLIALIPTVGDFIAKPLINLLKRSKEGEVAIKTGGKTLTDYLAKNPQIAEKFRSLGKYVKNLDPKISNKLQSTIKGIGKKDSNLGTTLKSSYSELATKLKSSSEMIPGGKVLSGLKAGGKEVVAGGKFKTGLKDYFRGERLSKYFAKHGVLPEKGIQKWWINVSARQDRRNAFRTFIGTNNLLDWFGIPSLTSFEERMSNDPSFREKIANDPKTSDYIAQNSQSGDETSPNTQSGGDENKSSLPGIMGGMMSLSAIKKLAQIYV